jgi:hypothetical protein
MANNDYDRDQYGNPYNRDYGRDDGERQWGRDRGRDPRERMGGYDERAQGHMGSFGERYDREDWRNRENFGQENWRGRQAMSGGGNDDQQGWQGRRDYGRDYGRDYSPGAQRNYGREYNQGGQREYRRDEDRGYVQQGQSYESRGTPDYGRQYGQGGYTGGGQNEDWRVPGPFTGRGPRGYQRSDERIREEVSDRLAQHGRIDASDMDVQVQNGEVTLSGNANSRDEKRMAEDVAASVPGVSDVNNQIKVKQGFLNQIKDALSGNPNQQPSDQTAQGQQVTH